MRVVKLNLTDSLIIVNPVALHFYNEQHKNKNDQVFFQKCSQ